jgi:hypothetical protein
LARSYRARRASIPNQGILINALGLQEAKDSSEIENIVTTHDELFRGDVLPDQPGNPAAKEVLRYRLALRLGFDQVRKTGLITSNHLIAIQSGLERNHAGFRKLPGTALIRMAATGIRVERPETLPPYVAGRGVPRLTRSLIAVHISCLSEGGRPRSGTA